MERTDAFDDLVGSTRAGVLAWMHRKAALADGTAPGVEVVDPATRAQAMAIRGPRTAPGDPVDREVERHWTELRAGLLRNCCSAANREIGRRLQCSIATAYRPVNSAGALVQARHPLVPDAAVVLSDAVCAQWPQTAQSANRPELLG